MNRRTVAASPDSVELPHASATRAPRTAGPSRWRIQLAKALLALLVAWTACAHAETRAYLLRGWFGVFSTGMDAMAEQLRAKGIKAEAIGHLEWKSVALKLAAERAAGATDRIALVGHSQGANNVIDMARELDKHGVAVDLLITLVPWLQEPVPANVVRAINYYQDPGWGTPLKADPGFKGELANVNIAGEASVFHINIDKDPRIQAEVVGAIAALQQ